MESKETKSSQDSTNARRELAELIKQKAELTDNLANLDAHIYALEESFLRGTADRGNIVWGWKRNQTPENMQRPITASDRIFSNSSVTSVITAKSICAENAGPKAGWNTKRFCGENAAPKAVLSTNRIGANEGTTIAQDDSVSIRSVGQVTKTGKTLQDDTMDICK